MRLFDQFAFDRQRRSYRLNFPNQLTEEQVVAWLRAINGSMTGRGSRPTLGFETWATSKGIEHRLKVPWQHADFIVSQLRSLVVGIRVTPEEEHPHRRWTRAVEVGLSNSTRPLRIFDSASVAASMLTALQPLKNDEAMVVQWVIAPAPPARLPVYKEARTDQPGMRNLTRGNEAGRDEVNERRNKLSEPNVLAILRIGAVSTTTGNASHLIGRVKAALMATRTASTKFVRRPAFLKGIQRRIDDVATPLKFPMQLSVPEFAALMTWPLGDPLVPGLPPVVGKQYPPNENIRREGIVIGSSTFSGAERPVALGYEEALMHTWVGGSTGCLHPDTPIYDPVDASTKSVRQRYDDGVDFHVYAMHGQSLVVARAEAPKRFHKSRMYRIYNEEHQIVVTPEHRVWDGQSWVEVGDFVRDDSTAVVHLPSISAAGLSRLQQDVPHLWRRHADSQDDCQICHHLCDRQPHQAAGTFRAAVPSRADAQEPCCSCADTDGRVRRQCSNRRYLSPARQSRSSSSLPSSRALEVLDPPPASTYESICLLPSCASGSGAGSSQSHKAGCTRQSVLSSTATVSSLDSTSFSSYFKDTIFRVEEEDDETYYDFHVPRYENYLAGGLINHNTGKSVALANMARQIMEDGHGLVVIEQAGDLYQSVLDYVPKHRLDDVVLLDVADSEHPVGFNVLDQGDPLIVIDQILDLFNHKYTKSMWAEEYIWHGLRTIAATPGLAFTDLPSLLVPRSDEVKWADSVQRNVSDPELRRWWQRQDNRDRTQQQQRADPVLSRVWQLASRPELRLIMGQSKSAFQMADVLRDNKILLVNLKGVSKETASLAGTLMMNSIWQSAKAVNKTKSTFVVLDEFGDFMDLPVDTETMLAQARKHKVGMILANQHLGQLPQSMREAVLANARNKVVLATNAEDARVLAREIGHGTDIVDFTTLQQYEAQVQLLTPFGVGQPVTIRTEAPHRATGNASPARSRSRAKYSRPRAEVYDEIDKRHQADQRVPTGAPPVIGGGA